MISAVSGEEGDDKEEEDTRLITHDSHFSSGSKVSSTLIPSSRDQFYVQHPQLEATQQISLPLNIFVISL